MKISKKIYLLHLNKVVDHCSHCTVLNALNLSLYEIDFREQFQNCWNFFHTFQYKKVTTIVSFNSLSTKKEKLRNSKRRDKEVIYIKFFFFYALLKNFQMLSIVRGRYSQFNDSYSLNLNKNCKRQAD